MHEKAKFTPGPWFAFQFHSGPSNDIRTALENPDLATVWAIGSISDDEAAANANLIAAAPEMYEKGAFKRNAIIHDNPDFEGEWIAIPREDFKAFQATRAKARGES